MLMILICFAILIIVAYFISKCEKPVLTALKSSLTGVGCLLLVNITAPISGCYIAINFYSSFVASVLSLPGVIALVFSNILFNY